MPFQLFRTLQPDGSRLDNPSLAQSHEPFLFEGRLYTVYEVNDRGRGFWDTTFRQPGELWLADLSSDPTRQWRIAPGVGADYPLTEPEPFVSDDCIRIFYNRVMTEEAVPTASGNEDDSQTGREAARRLFAERSGRFNGRGWPRFELYSAGVPLIRCGGN